VCVPLTSKLFSRYKKVDEKNYSGDTKSSLYTKKLIPEKNYKKVIEFLFSATKKIPGKIKRQGTVMMHNQGTRKKFGARQNEK
jgi:hypothetical protein